MDVLVLGGHGKIARRLLRRLADAGHAARGVIRDPAQADAISQAGASPIVFDLEHDRGLSRHLDGADAAVFAAGAGPGSGPDRKRTVDLGGAVGLIEACREAGVSRYVMVSAIGVGRPGQYPAAMEPYYEAKREADEALLRSGLEYTIVRPGRLTDDPGSGLVEVGAPLTGSGEIPRDDVAATLHAVLETPASAGLSFDLIGGATPIEAALASLATGA